MSQLCTFQGLQQTEFVSHYFAQMVRIAIIVFLQNGVRVGRVDDGLQSFGQFIQIPLSNGRLIVVRVPSTTIRVIADIITLKSI